MRVRVQLVVPCYNETHRFRPDEFLQLVGSRSDTGLIFVDDGSTDGTSALIADVVARSDGKASVLTLRENAGKAVAVQSGVLAAFERQPEFVGYWDADLSTPLAALADFLQVFETNAEVDLVMGARVKLLGRQIDRHAIRHYCGRAFATAASLALGVGVYDTQCGAKVFRANDSFREAFSAPFRSQWIFDVEVLDRYMTAVGGASAESRICEWPLQTWTDVGGSKLRPRHAIRALWDLAVIWRQSAGRRRRIKT
jgi:dolichyl-phosphate beta-glucosyltransferase